jgi:hypothetical protein
MLYTEAQALAEFCRAEARNLRRTAAQFGNDPDFIRMAEAWDRDANE